MFYPFWQGGGGPGGSSWAQAAQLRKGEVAGVWGFLGGQPTCSPAWDSLATSRVSEADGSAKEGQDPGGEVCAGGEGHGVGAGAPQALYSLNQSPVYLSTQKLRVDQ